MKKVLGINVNLSAVSWALADRAESDSETGALLRAGVRVPNLSPVEKLAFARGDAAATNLQRKEQCGKSAASDKCGFAQFRLRQLPKDAQCASSRYKGGYP